MRAMNSVPAAAYVELPDGRKLILIVLTRGAADDKTLLPAIGKHCRPSLLRMKDDACPEIRTVYR